MLTNLCHKQTVGLLLWFFVWIFFFSGAVLKLIDNTYGTYFQVERILFLLEAFQMTANVTQPV